MKISKEKIGKNLEKVRERERERVNI